MKKKIIFIILCLLIPIFCFAETKTLNIYLFKGEGCPHCRDLEAFLDDYIGDNSYIVLNEYEVWKNEDNSKMLDGVKKITGVESKGVPYLVIGEKTLVGYSELDNEEIINYINYYSNNFFEDKVGTYITDYLKDEESDDDYVINDVISDNDDLYNKIIIDNSTLPNNIKNIVSKNSGFVSSIILGLVSSFNFSFIFVLIIFMCIFFLYKDFKYKNIVSFLFLLSYFIVNFIFVSDIFDTSILLDKTIYIRVGLCSLLMIYSVFKIWNYFVKKNSKSNIYLVSLFSFVTFTLINILFVYSNVSIPSVFSQIVIDNKVFNSIMYSIFSVILFSLFFILFMELSRVKLIKNNYKKYYLILCIIILIISCIIISKPGLLF